MKTKVHVGIDISKNSFDVAIPLKEKDGYKHLKFKNNAEGFDNLSKVLAPESYCIMEASGVYYLN